MTTSFATNAASNSAVSYLHRNSQWQSSSIAKLSSGSRIVKASDDAASLAVGTKLRADITALKQASTNASQAASLMQVADGALSRISDSLLRMKSLATQARADTLSNTERGYLDQEFQEMLSQIDYITTSTKFNGKAVVDGSFGSAVSYGTETVLDASAESLSALAAGFANTTVSAMDGHTIADGTVFEIEFIKASDTMQLTNKSTGEVQQITSGNGANHAEVYEFDQLGVRVAATDIDTSADIAAATTTYAAAGKGITAETIGSVANGTTFSIAVTHAAGVQTLTLKNEDTSATEAVSFNADSSVTRSFDFSTLGIRLNFNDVDATSGALDASFGAVAGDDDFVVDQGSAVFQVGATAGADDFSVNFTSANSAALSVAGSTITSITSATAANSAIDAAIETINTQRAKLGANMSRIEKINENLATTMENLDSARSVLLDVDVAEEMTKFTTNQVMTQAATAMLAQANQLPQNLMKLLQ